MPTPQLHTQVDGVSRPELNGTVLSTVIKTVRDLVLLTGKSGNVEDATNRILWTVTVK